MQATFPRNKTRRIKKYTVLRRRRLENTEDVAADLLPWADPYIAMLAAKLRASAPDSIDDAPVEYDEASPPLAEPGYDFDIPRQRESWSFDEEDE